jgi:hypothetical protein
MADSEKRRLRPSGYSKLQALLDLTAHLTGPFCFFDLARELRDPVYQFVWTPTGLRKEPKDSYGSSQLKVTASYGYETDMSLGDRFDTFSCSRMGGNRQGLPPRNDATVVPQL